MKVNKQTNRQAGHTAGNDGECDTEKRKTQTKNTRG